MHAYIRIQCTYKTSIQHMAKQNIHGNIHAYTHISNLYDLIPQSSQIYNTMTIPWNQVFKGLNSLETDIG